MFFFVFFLLLFFFFVFLCYFGIICSQSVCLVLFVLKVYREINNFFTSDEYDLYFFTAANRSYFDNLGFDFFFQKRSGMHVLV